MTYRIEQSSEYVGKDYWRWSAWLASSESEAELDAVAEVVWILHPTFERSRVTSTDRSQKFRLDRAGWGTFLLKAEVGLKNGEKQLVKHYLQFEATNAKPPTRDVGTEASSEGRKPTIFLSYSTRDSRTAAKLREGFANEGFEVLDQTRLEPGEPWKESLQKMITQSDAVLGLVGPDDISPWVSAEIEAAGRAEKPAFALLTPESSNFGIPRNAEKLHVKNFDAPSIVKLLRTKSKT